MHIKCLKLQNVVRPKHRQIWKNWISNRNLWKQMSQFYVVILRLRCRFWRVFLWVCCSCYIGRCLRWCTDRMDDSNYKFYYVWSSFSELIRWKSHREATSMNEMDGRGEKTINGDGNNYLWAIRFDQCNGFVFQLMGFFYRFSVNEVWFQWVFPICSMWMAQRRVNTQKNTYLRFRFQSIEFIRLTSEKGWTNPTGSRLEV